MIICRLKLDNGREGKMYFTDLFEQGKRKEEKKRDEKKRSGNRWTKIERESEMKGNV